MSEPKLTVVSPSERDIMVVCRCRRTCAIKLGRYETGSWVVFMRNVPIAEANFETFPRIKGEEKVEADQALAYSGKVLNQDRATLLRILTNFDLPLQHQAEIQALVRECEIAERQHAYEKPRLERAIVRAKEEERREVVRAEMRRPGWYIDSPGLEREAILLGLRGGRARID